MSILRKSLIPVVALLTALTLSGCLPTVPDEPPPTRAGDQPGSEGGVQCPTMGLRPGQEDEPEAEETPVTALVCKTWSLGLYSSADLAVGLGVFKAKFLEDGTVQFESTGFGDFLFTDATGKWELTGNTLVVDFIGVESGSAAGEAVDIRLEGEFDGELLDLKGEGTDGLQYLVSGVGLVG